MKLPRSLGSLAPEGDLRSIGIRASKERASANIAVDDRTGNAGPSDLFVSKGKASAESFRPARLAYERALAEAASVAPPAGKQPANDSAQLSRDERAFLDNQRRILENWPAYQAEMAVEEPLPMPSSRANLPPEADLRMVDLRPKTGAPTPTASLSGTLFAKKGEAAVTRPPTEEAIEPLPESAVSEPGPVLAPAVPSVEPRPGLSDHLRMAAIAITCAALLVAAALSTYRPAPSFHAAASGGAIVQLPAPPNSANTELLSQGDSAMIAGDIYSARRFYIRAAEAKSARAALLVGLTYDPTFLASIGVYGLRGDEKEAASWYRRAQELGDPAATQMLQGLKSK
jgi:hypothetical protein